MTNAIRNFPGPHGPSLGGPSRQGTGSPDTPTTPLAAVKVEPMARACGAPLTGLP